MRKIFQNLQEQLLNEIDGKSMQAYIYTMDGCPYCTWAEELLDTHGIAYVENNIDHGGWNDFQSAFGSNSTLPQIFIANVPAGSDVQPAEWNYIGGYTELKEYLNSLS